MAALEELVAHGGAAGAMVEALIALAVVAVLVAVWVRERETAPKRPEGFTDDELS